MILTGFLVLSLVEISTILLLTLKLETGFILTLTALLLTLIGFILTLTALLLTLTGFILTLTALLLTLIGLRLILTPLLLTLTLGRLWLTCFGRSPMLIAMTDWFRYRFYCRLMPCMRWLTDAAVFWTESLLPIYSCTHWIMVWVSASPALSPSHTSCHSLVELSRFKAYSWLLSLASQVAIFLKISWTTGIPSKRYW